MLGIEIEILISAVHLAVSAVAVVPFGNKAPGAVFFVECEDDSHVVVIGGGSVAHEISAGFIETDRRRSGDAFLVPVAFPVGDGGNVGGFTAAVHFDKLRVVGAIHVKHAAAPFPGSPVIRTGKEIVEILRVGGGRRGRGLVFIQAEGGDEGPLGGVRRNPGTGRGVQVQIIGDSGAGGGVVVAADGAVLRHGQGHLAGLGDKVDGNLDIRGIGLVVPVDEAAFVGRLGDDDILGVIFPVAHPVVNGGRLFLFQRDADFRPVDEHQHEDVAVHIHVLEEEALAGGGGAELGPGRSLVIGDEPVSVLDLEFGRDAVLARIAGGAGVTRGAGIALVALDGLDDDRCALAHIVDGEGSVAVVRNLVDDLAFLEVVHDGLVGIQGVHVGLQVGELRVDLLELGLDPGVIVLLGALDEGRDEEGEARDEGKDPFHCRKCLWD